MKSVKKVQIKPTKAQREQIEFWFRRCVVLYNVALEEKISFYQKTGRYLNAYEQKKELVGLKQDDPSWKDVPNKALSEIIFRLDDAFQGFFKGKGFPSFKNEDKLHSIEFVEKDVRVKNGLVFLPKMKQGIKGVEEFPTKFSTVKLKREGGEFFLCFTIDIGVEQRQVDEASVVGGDLGLKTMLTDSNGYEVKRFDKKLIDRYQERIAKLNASMAKKKKGSKARKKVKKHLKKAHLRLKNTRNDFIQKESTKYVNQVKEDVIVFGNLGVHDLMESDGTKKQTNISDAYSNAGVKKFASTVQYKAQKHGKQFVFADEEFTSKTCSCCSVVNHNLKVSDRVFDCGNCGISIPRDLNAAINIRKVHLKTFHPIGVDVQASIDKHKNNKLLGSNKPSKKLVGFV